MVRPNKEEGLYTTLLSYSVLHTRGPSHRPPSRGVGSRSASGRTRGKEGEGRRRVVAQRGSGTKTTGPTKQSFIMGPLSFSLSYGIGCVRTPGSRSVSTRRLSFG